MTVLRYDNAPLRKATRTPQGFLRAPARVTRAGVFAYTQDDGSVVHELRHPDDVFEKDSLASLASAPVTDLHPPRPVTAESADVIRGHGSESPRRDGAFVATDITVTHGDLIAKCDAGERKEISLGYTCKIVPENGVYQGERYDQRQTQIRYNHIALGPAGWGRAGSAVSLRMDSDTDRKERWATRFDDISEMSHIPGMDLIEVRIDGATVHVEKASADAVTRGDAALVAARADASKEKARADVAEAALAQAKADLAQATDPAAVSARADARIALVTDARKILGEDFKADGKPDADVMRAALAKARPELKLDGKDVAYVEGAFRAVCDSVGKDSLAAVRQPEPTPTQRVDAKAARQARIAKSATAWTTLGKGNDK